MIKVVVQSIPTYSMSVFWLPIGLLKDIEAMIHKFWWECSENSRKIHWVKWETICSSKSLEVWVFVTYDCSMMQCWGSKFGAYFIIGTP